MIHTHTVVDSARHIATYTLAKSMLAYLPISGAEGVTVISCLSAAAAGLQMGAWTSVFVFCRCYVVLRMRITRSL